MRSGPNEEWLVVEADESDGTHLELPLFGTILTNVEVDHLDFYGTEEAIVAGFDQYLSQISGPKVLCIDDPVCAELATRHGAITYGTSPAADYRAVDVHAEHGSYTFTVVRSGETLGTVDLPLRGIHNVRNALGALAMACTVGVDFEIASRALAKFGGVARRFDIRGIDGGATLVDDYAHLPERDQRGAGRGALQRRRLAASRRGVPTESLQPHGGHVARLPRRLRGCRPGGAHRHLCLGHDSDPRGHRQARRQCRSRRASDHPVGLDAAPQPT